MSHFLQHLVQRTLAPRAELQPRRSHRWEEQRAAVDPAVAWSMVQADAVSDGEPQAPPLGTDRLHALRRAGRVAPSRAAAVDGADSEAAADGAIPAGKAEKPSRLTRAAVGQIMARLRTDWPIGALVDGRGERRTAPVSKLDAAILRAAEHGELGSDRKMNGDQPAAPVPDGADPSHLEQRLTATDVPASPPLLAHAAMLPHRATEPAARATPAAVAGASESTPAASAGRPGVPQPHDNADADPPRAIALAQARAATRSSTEDDRPARRSRLRHIPASSALDAAIAHAEAAQPLAPEPAGKRTISAAPVAPPPRDVPPRAAPSAPGRAAVNAEPTVQVTIGRVEIRAVVAPAALPAGKRTAQAKPVLSLTDYLERRGGGGWR